MFSRIDNQLTAHSRARLAAFGVVVVLVSIVGYSAGIARAVAPPTIFSYQGRILDDVGVPIADATASMVFRIFDGPDTGTDTCLWSNSSASCASATAMTITLSDGLFSENLGDTSVSYAAINESVFADNATLYLAVTINGEALTPLRRITSQGLAVNSSLLDGLDTGASGGTSAYVPVTGSNGNLVITGNPQGSGVAQGSLYINPSAPDANETIFGAANNGSVMFRIDAEGDATVTGSLTVNGSAFTASTLTSFNCSDCINGDDLADTISLDSNTIFALASSNLTISGSGVGDLIFNPDSDTNFQITATASPTADMIAVTNASFASATDGVDALSISFSGSNESGTAINITPVYDGDGSDTFTVINLAALTATTSAGTDTVTGIAVGALTEAGAGAISSAAISIGAGWDNQLSATGFTIAGGGATGITPSSNVDALTITGTNITSNNLFALNPGNTSGTIIDAAYGSAVSQAGSLIGMNLDLHTNLTAANGADLSGVVVTTLGGTRAGSGTESYTGFSATSGGALTQNTLTGTIAWRGFSAVIPAITQTTGTVSADGVLVTFPASSAITTGGTSTGLRLVPPSTSGPSAGTLTGLSIGNLVSAGAGTENAISIGTGWDSQINATGFTVSGTGTTTITPSTDLDALTVTGTNVTTNNLLVLNAANVSGAIIDVGYGSATTQTGNLIGMNLDLSTNFTGANNANIIGASITTAGGTRTGSGTETYSGINIASGAALAQTTSSGILNWFGIVSTIPAITQTTGTVSAEAFRAVIPVSGAITTGGTMTGLNVVAPTTSGPAAGTLRGVNISALTSAGAGTENALVIGSGWDNQISGTGFTIEGTGITTITPSGNTNALNLSGTNITSGSLLSGDTRNTSGNILAVAYGGTTTQTGTLVGLSMNLNTNLTLGNNQSTTGISLNLAGGVMTGSGTETIIGHSVAGGNITQTTLSGSIAWRGFSATVPAVMQTTGTVTADGMRIALQPSGAITTGGTVNGLFILAPTTSGADAGTLTGINIGSLTSAGAGTENALSIGDGWDLAINVNAGQMTVSTAGVIGVGLDNTATTNGLCHSGSDVDAGTGTTRDIVACSAAPDDYAEWYDSDGSVRPGDVVALTDDTITYMASQSNPYTGQIIGTVQKTLPVLTKATAESGTRVFGIVSTSPIQVIGSDLKRQGSHPVPIALTGRVPLNVTNENGAIAPGDVLTASTTPGFAMKANEGDVVVAVALGALEAASGTIQSFVRFGAGTIVNESAAENTATLTTSQSMGSLNMGGNIYMNGHSLLSVASIEGLGGRWSINEDGVFSTQGVYQAEVETTQGTRGTVYSTMSPEVTLTLSGTATFSGGQAVINFIDVDPIFNSVISTVAPIRVIVTANGPVSGLYVSEKDNNGFTVQGGGDGLSFDWLVIAYRNGYEPKESLELEIPAPAEAVTEMEEDVAESAEEVVVDVAEEAVVEGESSQSEATETGENQTEATESEIAQTEAVDSEPEVTAEETAVVPEAAVQVTPTP